MNIRELAKLAKVSPATVSMALNGKKGVNEETRRRILKLAATHNYSGVQESALTGGDVLVIKYWGHGMLVEENQQTASAMIDALEATLSAHTLTVLTVKNFATWRVNWNDYCGAVVIASHLPKDLPGCLAELPIPCVLVDNAAPGLCCSAVSAGNSESVHLALCHLKACGHQEIGYVDSSLETENFFARRAAFDRWRPDLPLHGDVAHRFSVFPTVKGAFHDFQRILASAPPLPGCLLAACDAIALGVIHALQEGGFSVPGDLSVMGMEDLPAAAACVPPLTTVRFPRDRMGVCAGELLLKQLQAHEAAQLKIQLTGDLVQRGSVKQMTGTPAVQ